MVKKESVGKFQVWFGIVLLILVVIGFILLYNYSSSKGLSRIGRNYGSESEMLTNVFEGYSDDTREILANSFLNHQELKRRDYINRVYILLSSLIILLTISILFITQGLANKPEAIKSKVRRNG